jgi:serine/threonine-protein kinase
VCLATDPDERLQNAHDVVQELRWLRDAGQPLSTGGKAARPQRVWLRVGLGALAGALVAAAVLSLRMPARPPPRSVLRFAIDVPASRQVAALAFSPDGTQLVYVGIEGGQRALFLHSRDRFGETRIPGTEGATWSFFSPDGSWIAFFAGGRLNRVRADGTDLSTICRVGGNANPSQEGHNSTGTWAEDGTIILSSDTAGLSRLSAPGAEPVPVTRLESDKGELAHAWPHVLPDNKTILFSILTGMAFDAVPAAAVSLETGVRRIVLKNASAPRYLSTGHLLYADSGILAAVPFDRERLQVVGAPMPIVEDLSYARDPRSVGAEPQFALSRAGDLAYVVRRPELPSTLVRVDRKGRSIPIADLPDGFRTAMSLTPDGRRLALYRVENRKMAIWTLDIGRGVLSKAVAEGNPHAAVWSPDGQRLAFSSDRSGAANIFVQAADGTGKVEQLVNSPRHADPGSWSTDGRWLAYAEADPVTGWDVWALDFATRQAISLRRTAAAEQHPALSPGGRWVAYASDESGRFEVYVEAFPAGGRRLQLSVDGGAEPLWAPDGRQLFYRSGDQLMSVRVTSDAVLSAERPVKVLDAPYPYSSAYGNAGYAVAPDGQHFYFLRPAPQPDTPTRINVVVNWLEELKARVAAGEAR